MNILIYGYGEIGKGLYELCLMLKLHVKVVDDCIPLALVGSKSCISLSALDAGDIDKAFVCNHNAQIAKKMQDRLLKIGIDKQKIKIFNEVFYKRSFKKILKKSFNHTQDIANELLNNTDDFIESMKKVKQEYFKFKDKQNLRDAKRLREFDALGLNAFATMYATKALSNDINCILYPGFSVGCSGGKDLEFHFMDKIDFLALSKRPKDLKLVACFGDSCMQGDYLQENHRLTYLLQKRLGEGYKVLNFGISGFSQYEQMMLYNALVYPLKPEIVISLFMGWDFFNYVSCKLFAYAHQMYHS